jgi:hypothetical protein
MKYIKLIILSSPTGVNLLQIQNAGHSMGYTNMHAAPSDDVRADMLEANRQFWFGLRVNIGSFDFDAEPRN